MGKRARKEVESDDEIASSGSEEDIDLSENDVEVDDPENRPEAKDYKLNDDPYLMEEATYIKNETRWRNKQRTLVFGSRGIDGRHRHLMEDIKKMLPNHKAESKFDKKTDFREIAEICELKSCNNCVFIETRKGARNCYMHVARVPTGPTFKFQLFNVHTSAEVKLSGNCLLGSRPLLNFEAVFDTKPHLKLMKELFQQVFGTPRNHPKAKPFHDHVMSFFWLDGKVWVRHYQISPESPEHANDPEHQQLTEIGPRMVLEPIYCLAGPFSGKKIYQNQSYVSPVGARRIQKMKLAEHTRERILDKAKRAKHKEDHAMPQDELDGVFA